MKLFKLMKNILELRDSFGKLDSRLESIDRSNQILLEHNYKSLGLSGTALPDFRSVEFSSFSQNGEDGILLLIFSLIGGGRTRKVVEICAGDGIECNGANLVVNHGWQGLFVDGDPKLIARGKKFYRNRTNAWRFSRHTQPQFLHAWVTTENINQLLLENDYTGSIDLLSLDLDSVDFWIWESLNVANPRVVVLEFNNRIPADLALTVPNIVGWTSESAGVDTLGYFGASLKAFNLLAVKKGYRLIGVNEPSTNAFFMREDVGKAYFDTVSVDDCLRSSWAIHQQTRHWESLSREVWVDVSNTL